MSGRWRRRFLQGRVTGMAEALRVWITRPLFDDVLARVREYAQVRVSPLQQAPDAAELKRGLAEVDGAILNLADRVDATTLDGNTRLKAVANASVGYNNLDIEALTAAGVQATNTPDVLNETTADHAWALMLAASRRVAEGDRFIRAGRWKRLGFAEFLGRDVHGRTLGILGMGRIGQAVARRAQGFGMRVIYHNRSPLDAATERACRAEYVDKAALLARSDQLLLLLPYTPAAHHIIGAAELAAMKPGAVLVNIARGGLVDDQALAASLRDGPLAAAGLDVFEGEPAVCAALRACENAVLTPHIGSATEATRRAMAHRAVDNLLAALDCGPDAGHPPCLLNPGARRKR